MQGRSEATIEEQERWFLELEFFPYEYEWEMGTDSEEADFLRWRYGKDAADRFISEIRAYEDPVPLTFTMPIG